MNKRKNLRACLRVRFRCGGCGYWPSCRPDAKQERSTARRPARPADVFCSSKPRTAGDVVQVDRASSVAWQLNSGRPIHALTLPDAEKMAIKNNPE